MDLLIALIPALPLAGFLFAVLAGPRLDHVPVHGHGDGHDAHDADDHGDHDSHDVDESGFRPAPTEEEQRATSPHAGHADDLANAAGADGVIPPDLNDGLGQAGHVTPGADRPRYRSWIVPTGLVGVMWVLSMIVFANVIFGGNEYEVTVYEWISSGDFHIEISFLVDALTAMLLLVVSTVGLPGPRVLDRLHGRRPRLLALLRLPEPVHVQHAAADPGRQLRDAVRGLGGGRPVQLRAHRLLVQEALGRRRRQEGVHRQPCRRLRVRPRDHDALGQPRYAELPRGVRAHRDARRGHDHGDRAAPLRRRRRQERPVPAPRLAARRDGGTNTGQRAHPRRHHGQRRRLPRRARQPDFRRGADRHVGGGRASASSPPSSPPPSR